MFNSKNKEVSKQIKNCLCNMFHNSADIKNCYGKISEADCKGYVRGDICGISELQRIICQAMNYPEASNGFERYVEAFTVFSMNTTGIDDAIGFIFDRNTTRPEYEQVPLDEVTVPQILKLCEARLKINPYIRELKLRYGVD